MMRRIQRALLLALATLAIWIAGSSPGSAYTFWWVNAGPTGSPNIVSISMHTVSFFCSNVSWQGVLRPFQSIGVDSSSICLVDSVQATDSRGTVATWSGAGLAGATFYVRAGGRISVVPCGFTSCQPPGRKRNR